MTINGAVRKFHDVVAELVDGSEVFGSFLNISGGVVMIQHHGRIERIPESYVVALRGF